jgi:hypothetical protein
MAQRVTAFGSEVLHSGGPTTARVTTAAAEVLHSGGTTHARVSAIAVEVLRSAQGQHVSAFAVEVLRSLTIAPPSGQPSYLMIASSGDGTTVSANDTNYGSWSPYGILASSVSIYPEADVMARLRGTGGLFSRMTINVTAGGSTTGASTMRFRKNGLDGYMAVSTPANTTGWFTDLTDTDTAVAGDNIGFSFKCGPGTFSVQTIRAAICRFVPDTAHAVTLNSTTFQAAPNGHFTSLGAAATVYGTFLNQNLDAMINLSSSSMSQVEGRFGVAPGTLSNFTSKVRRNPASAGTITATLMVASGQTTTGLSISIPVGTTGEFSDNTDTYTFSGETGLMVKYVFSATNSGVFDVNAHSVTFTGTDGRHDLTVPFGSGAGNESGTSYGNARAGNSTTEAPRQLKAPFDLIYSNLRCLSNNAPSAACTLKSRINGTDGSQAVSITGSGWFEDVSGSDYVQEGDFFNHSTSGGTRFVYAVGATVRESPRIDDCNYIILE